MAVAPLASLELEAQIDVGNKHWENAKVYDNIL
jgi:hypothetical protein